MIVRCKWSDERFRDFYAFRDPMQGVDERGYVRFFINGTLHTLSAQDLFEIRKAGVLDFTYSDDGYYLLFEIVVEPHEQICLLKGGTSMIIESDSKPVVKDVLVQANQMELNTVRFLGDIRVGNAKATSFLIIPSGIYIG